MITFREQYDKLVGAYLKNQVIPTESCACFVGNLLNGTRKWRCAREYNFMGNPSILYSLDNERAGIIEISKEGKGMYTLEDISVLEDTFMLTWCDKKMCNSNEDALYTAFEKALIKLKEIHESKGEIVENYIFQKRQSDNTTNLVVS